jgi:hypothetical protein
MKGIPPQISSRSKWIRERGAVVAFIREAIPLYRNFEMNTIFGPKMPVMAAMVFFMTVFSSSTRAEKDNAFGFKEVREGALIGILYDFKQTPAREPIEMNLRKYYATIENFMNSGWDEGELRDFYRSTKAIYATQIFISMRRDSEAPAAFGVQKHVRPAYWMAHYKGQVIPPKPGTYRFVASADGFMAIAVNNKTIYSRHLSRRDLIKEVGPEEIKGRAANGRLRYSLPFDSDGITPIDLDVIIAEAGGMMNAFLLYKRDGESYLTMPDGFLLYPVFQLGDMAIPTGEVSQMPKAAEPKEWWKAVP